tara:strand:+ start:97 stop:963 length:867 start_codon:yes stop_codon:yes gene_type:complete
MPELPEVEVVKKSLRQTIYGLKIKGVEIRNKFLRYKIDEKLLKKMKKSKVLSVSRRSKYILIKLNNSYTILIHLGMTGKIIIEDINKKKYRTSFYYKTVDKNTKHDHLILKFSRNISLIYNDVRKFGFIKIFKTDKINQISHLKKLGPEPLSKKFNINYVEKKLKRRKIFLKDFLMNQNFVAGLGNIYVNEAIFLSKINPKLRVNNISNKKINVIISKIKKILKKAILEGGSSIKNFNDAKGKKGNFQQFFNVYGRQGKLCTRLNCRGIIRRTRISNRSTFFCDICQK